MWKPISNTAGQAEKKKVPYGAFLFIVFTCLKVRLIRGSTFLAVFGTWCSQ